MDKKKLLEKLRTLNFTNIPELHVRLAGITAAEIMENQDNTTGFNFSAVQSTLILSSDAKNALNQILKDEDTEAAKKILDAINGKVGGDRTPEQAREELNVMWGLYRNNPINNAVVTRLQEANIKTETINKLQGLRTTTQIRIINDTASYIFPKYSIYDWQKAGLPRETINIIMAKHFPSSELRSLTMNMPYAKTLLHALGADITDIKDTSPQKDLIEKLRDSLMKGPIEEGVVQKLQDADIEKSVINKLEHLAFSYSPPDDHHWSIMQNSESKTAFIDTHFASMGDTPAKKTYFINRCGYTIVERLRAFNFSPRDYIGSKMPLAMLQTYYSVDSLQDSDFDLEALIAARKDPMLFSFSPQPLMSPIQKGGIFGRIYTESITVDFARQLLSAGLTTKELHNELETSDMGLLQRFMTNINVSRAYYSLPKKADSYESLRTTDLSSNQDEKGNKDDNSLTRTNSTESLTARSSSDSLESESELRKSGK